MAKKVEKRMKFFLELLKCQDMDCGSMALATVLTPDGSGTRITTGCGGPWMTVKRFVVDCDAKTIQQAVEAFPEIVETYKKRNDLKAFSEEVVKKAKKKAGTAKK